MYCNKCVHMQCTPAFRFTRYKLNMFHKNQANRNHYNRVNKKYHGKVNSTCYPTLFKKIKCFLLFTPKHLGVFIEKKRLDVQSKIMV